MKTGKFLQTKLRLVLTVSVIILSAAVKPVKAQVNYADSLALVEFYNSTNGASWSSSTNWLTGPVSTWEGITVANDRVTSIYLPFNNLTGTLPYHIGFLHKLTFFGIPGNAVGGEIPSAIIFLSQLEDLDLSGNAFTGNIPPLMGFNIKLTSLNLSDNQLTGPIPSSLALLQKVVLLNLSFNQLSGQIPSALGFLSKVERFFLQNNQLTGSIPATVGYQHHVVDFNLSNNLLTGSIPSAVDKLDSISRFNVANNDLTGKVPAGLATLPQLSQIDVSGNELSILPNLTSSASLVQLRVRDNRFTFEDLEPNKPKLPSPSFYAPQDSVGAKQTVTICAGDTLRLSADFTGSLPNNRYQWRSTDGTFVGLNSADPVLTIPNAQPSDSKTYFARCSNTVVTGLNIIRRPVVVTVAACASGSGFQEEARVYPTPFADQTTVNIAAENDEDLELVILNEGGKVEQTIRGLRTNQDVKIGESLKSGMYYLQSTHGGKKEVRRIIKE